MIICLDIRKIPTIFWNKSAGVDILTQGRELWHHHDRRKSPIKPLAIVFHLTPNRPHPYRSPLVACGGMTAVRMLRRWPVIEYRLLSCAQMR